MVCLVSLLYVDESPSRCCRSFCCCCCVCAKGFSFSVNFIVMYVGVSHAVVVTSHTWTSLEYVTEQLHDTQLTKK